MTEPLRNHGDHGDATAVNAVQTPQWHRASGVTGVLARSRKTYLRPLTIWNRSLEVLNMTIDLGATDFALAITHELCDQSCDRFTICPRFHHFAVVAMS